MDMAVYHLQSFKEVKEKHPCWSADLNNTAEPAAAGHPYCYLSRERKKLLLIWQHRDSQILQASFMLDAV